MVKHRLASGRAHSRVTIHSGYLLEQRSRVKESSQVQSEKWLTLFGLDLERSFDRYTFGFPKGIHATENPIRHR